jgi:ribosomal protein L11 methylase PrmA
MHARMIQRAAKAGEAKGEVKGGVSLQQQLGLVDNLTSWVRRLPIRYQQSHWSEYYETSTYEEESLAQKERIVGDYLAQVGGQKAVDLGANTGRFSRLAAARGLSVLACDNDEGVVEEIFRESEGSSLLPLVIDLVNPPAAGGWAHQERASFSDRARADVVLALALIHHLAIGNNVPLVEIARFMGRLAPALIIEFVPKSDPQAQRLLAAREDIFADYDEDGFTEAFSSVFEIQRREPVGEMGRTLFLMARRAAV